MSDPILVEKVINHFISNLEQSTGMKILNLYSYGSRVYQVHRDDSDFDYIGVAETDTPRSEFRIQDMKVDITLYSQEEFQRLLDEHELSVLECYFLREGKVREHSTSMNIIRESVKFNFKLDKSKLRESVSAKCSNSWVKAKKKLTDEKDYDPLIAKKSLWHVFRMYSFGTQIAEEGKIFDYGRTHNMLKSIMEDPNDWKVLQDKWQPVRNAFATDFKKLAPKND